MTTYRKKLIEVALPLDAINAASQRENFIYKGNPSAVHKWWAQRPLAAARAVLFAQLVDDPSAWPDLFPTEEDQEQERHRLFKIIRDFVPWEAGNDEQLMNPARLEIARSWARTHPSPKASRVLTNDVRNAEVADYLATEVPPVHDPFAGGGTIPLEAQRLGLRTIATDLNPVAVLLNKALIEFPPLFSGLLPVNPESQRKIGTQTWQGTQGLADDIRYYGAWVHEEAGRQIGHVYPKVKITREMAQNRLDLKGLEGQEFSPLAWLWARTVASPNPAAKGAHVPLASNFWLSTKEGKRAWVEPIVQKEDWSYRFDVRTGEPPDSTAVDAGTKLGRGANFRCLLSGSGVPIQPDHIKAEGMAGRLGLRMMAVMLEGNGRRFYVSPSDDMQSSALNVPEASAPDEQFVQNSRHMTPSAYGINSFASLFTPRQAFVLTKLSDLVIAVRKRVVDHARQAGMEEGVPLRDGGKGAVAYGEAISLYLAFALNKCIEYSNSLVVWYPKEDRPKGVFARQALPMVWDFAEINTLGNIGGTFLKSVGIVADSVPSLLAPAKTEVFQWDAATAIERLSQRVIVSTDPPYYDNVPYADLSDFFYVWLRRTLRSIFPGMLATITVPKEAELVADPFRHGGKKGAEVFFLRGMTQAMTSIVSESVLEVPATVYYAFKQVETKADAAAARTGWETFLQAMVEAGFVIDGTWPVRSERQGRARDIESNALASSIVLVCRRRDRDAAIVTRGDFRRLLRAELPDAVKALQHGNIAPVDLAQASIGPGMAIFSRHAKVVEADGQAMSVRSALQMINEALDEYLSAQEGEADPDTRFALTWFETNGWSTGRFGDAETLAKARNISVAGIVESGILHSAAGNVRLLTRSEMPAGWDPRQDTRVPVWEATQHLIRRLEEQGEPGAAALHHQLGPLADHAHDLAYRLYSICERKGWAEDARAYNGLVTAWPEISRLAAAVAEAPPTAPGQMGLGLLGAEPPAAKKKPARKPRKST